MKCVNTNNPKNKYCDHCEYCDFSFVENCRLKKKRTRYWQRCKDFKWKHEYLCRIFREARLAGRKNAYCPYQQEDGKCFCENCHERVKDGDS